MPRNLNWARFICNYNKKAKIFRRFIDNIDKQKKSCYLAEEGQIDEEYDDWRIWRSYLCFYEILEEERYEEEKSPISQIDKTDTWIIDSGCPHHMIGYIEKFEKLGSVWWSIF